MTDAITSFTGEYRFLSNFYQGSQPVYYSNQMWPTAEHAYQASKCVRLDEQAAIREAKTPGEAKRLGQKAQLIGNWELVKRRVMLRVVSSKFMEDYDLMEKLDATGDRQLVEGNTWGDTYWGVCNGMGENYLGRALMLTRDAVRFTMKGIVI